MGMGTSFNLSGSKGVLLLENELTLPYAADLRTALIKSLLDADDISIAVRNVRDIDLSCLQLLCSAQRSAVRLRKRVAFTGRLPKIFKNLVAAAGFARAAGCKQDCGKDCLWTDSGVKNDR
jgi:ABC-type transporter Mla MlaB component